VQLLEKAWAKLNGSYESTIHGLPSDALKCLSGAPVEFYSHDFHDEELWEIFRESDRRKYIITGSSATDQSDEVAGEKDLKGVGLVSDHAYSVISVIEVKQAD
jgi:Calpain family cysteine protease